MPEQSLHLTKPPVATAEMLIRKPVSEVFEDVERGIALNLVLDRFPDGIG